jgi:sigma-E factor negative regulatory protein RseA
MNQQIHEQLSALMDGELDRDETRFLLKRLATDHQLPARWTRYHVVRQILRRQQMTTVRPDFADAVMARLTLEPAVRARSATTWLRWGAGGAIAASVAVAALVLTQPAEESVPGPGSAIAHNAISPSAVPIAVAPVAATTATQSEFRPPLLAPSVPVETAPASFGSDLSQPIAIDPRMQSYLIRHYQAAGAAGQSGFVPYVLLGSPQREASMATQPPEPARQNR